MQLFPKSVFELIAYESCQYAPHKGNFSYHVSVNEINAFISINISMAYIMYPNLRMYWSGIRMDQIADIMPVNRFCEIKRFFTFYK